jgi:cytochrome P450
VVNEISLFEIIFIVFAEFQLLRIISQLFVAGTETTATALQWFSLFMIRNTDVQDKMRKEINDVIGSSRFPSMADKPHLPYCQAVLHEVLRQGPLVPTSVPHGLTHDLQYKGFTIPKDAILIPNLYSVSFDNDIFPDPHVFRPERFLDEKGNLQHTDKVLTFSLGKQTLQF